LPSRPGQALDNTAAILEAAGSSLAKVVSSSIFLTEFDQVSRVNAVYSKYFPQDGPAKFGCGVTSLYGGAKFEIQVIALA
jgi:2-iminobutanoate/2-iminopropanoate deaminase